MPHTTKPSRQTQTSRKNQKARGSRRIERMCCDPDWLDKAIRIVEKQIQEMNRKQKGKETEVSLAQ